MEATTTYDIVLEGGGAKGMVFVGAMQEFLERGFAALKSLKRVDVFLQRIEVREKAILNRIYGLPGGAPADNPFLVSDGGPPEVVL